MMRSALQTILLLLAVNSLLPGQNKPQEFVLTEGNYYNIGLKDESGLPDVKAALTFNKNSLLFKAIVKDNHFKDGDRSWRHGDGFFINFVTPENSNSDSSNKFYSFGFSLQNGKPVSIVVNKDGEYFPKISAPPIPQIKIDTNSKTAEYLIKIPWENIYPFNPLIDSLAGINIVYISQNDDRSRKINMLVDDNYDTEMTNYRKFIPVKFKISGRSNLQFAFSLDSKLISSQKLTINYSAFSPIKTDVSFKADIYKNDSLLLTGNMSAALSAGLNKFQQKMEFTNNPGLYKISITLNDSLTYRDNFVVLDPAFISGAKKEIDAAAADSSLTVSLSASTLNYQLNVIQNRINSFNKRKSLEELQKSIETFTSLLGCYKNAKNIFIRDGYFLAAFQSSSDFSLQPFSIVLPANFNQNKKYNLLIALHGSGVDEVSYIKYAAKMFAQNDFIIIAPRGRGLSDWYMGLTEKDVVDLVKKVKIVFNVDKSILYGFSMGGYGVWRFGILYPELFDAAIVASGCPFNPWTKSSESELDNFVSKEKKLNYLVLHGTSDNSLDISYTDKFISKLKALNYNIAYKKFEGAGHGNYDSKEVIQNWLNKIFEK